MASRCWRRLPPVWTAGGADPTWAFVSALPNRPFKIDAAPERSPGPSFCRSHPDLVHRFYQNQMQINGGRDDQFAAWSDAGGLAMGYYDGSTMGCGSSPSNIRWPTTSSRARSAARSSTISGWSAPASPVWPNAPAANVSSVDAQRHQADACRQFTAQRPHGRRHSTWPTATSRPRLADGNFYAINTTQPPYQPSATLPAGRRRSAPCRPGRRRPRCIPSRADRADDRRSADGEECELGLVRRRLEIGPRRRLAYRVSISSPTTSPSITSSASTRPPPPARPTARRT